jgi:hypothetical protein
MTIAANDCIRDRLKVPIILVSADTAFRQVQQVRPVVTLLRMSLRGTSITCSHHEQEFQRRHHHVFHARITTHMTELKDILDGLLGQQPEPMPRVTLVKKGRNKRKTKLCMYHARGKCPLDVADCNFAHGENDLVS